MYVHNKVTDRSDMTSNTEREAREMLRSTVERCENYSTLSVSIPVFSTSFCQRQIMSQEEYDSVSYSGWFPGKHARRQDLRELFISYFKGRIRSLFFVSSCSKGYMMFMTRYSLVCKPVFWNLNSIILY